MQQHKPTQQRRYELKEQELMQPGYPTQPAQPKLILQTHMTYSKQVRE